MTTKSGWFKNKLYFKSAKCHGHISACNTDDYINDNDDYDMMMLSACFNGVQKPISMVWYHNHFECKSQVCPSRFRKPTSWYLVVWFQKEIHSENHNIERVVWLKIGKHIKIHIANHYSDTNTHTHFAINAHDVVTTYYTTIQAIPPARDVHSKMIRGFLGISAETDNNALAPLNGIRNEHILSLCVG